MAKAGHPHSPLPSKPAKNLRPLNPFVLCHCFQNRIQGAQPKILMGWNCYSLVGWGVCLKNDVTPHLMHDCIVPIPTKETNQVGSTQVARNFHPFAKTSSRVKCRRIAEGMGLRSKKNAETASLTFFLKLSQSLASVNIGSLRHSATNPPSDSCVTSKTISMHLDYVSVAK